MKRTSLLFATMFAVLPVTALAQGPLDGQDVVDMTEPPSEADEASGIGAGDRDEAARARAGVEDDLDSPEFTVFDNNGDGVVDEREAGNVGMGADVFALVDINDDGAISREEYVVYIQTNPAP
jgi:hypothetical protein